MRYDYPFKGRFKVTCPFGRRGAWKCGWHIGTDIVGMDDKNVCAIADGVVESVNAHGTAYGEPVCAFIQRGGKGRSKHQDWAKGGRDGRDRERKRCAFAFGAAPRALQIPG